MSAPADLLPGADRSSTCKVLVVDDNRMAADMLALLLGVYGHEVRAAYDGQAALEELSAWTPDVVLLDLLLPYMSGQEVARVIRSRSELDEVRLIALTGYSWDDERVSGLIGFDGVLVKPAPPEEILAAVQAWSRLEQAGRSR
ncbi:MAG: response regulator [Gemmataceae bacterium]